MNSSTKDAADYGRDLLDSFVAFIPNLVGALVILLVGYVVAKIIQAVIRKILSVADLDERLHSGQGGNYIQRAIPSPTRFISKFAFWVVYLFGVSIALTALGIPVLVDFVRGVYAYLPNVVAALLIFLVAGAISGAIAGLVHSTMGNTATGRLVATAAPALVMGLAVFMILTQLKIAPAIVTITYGGIVATLTLAFGLGGRDVASQMLQGLYDKGLQNKDAAKADLRVGKANAKNKADKLRNRIK